jgi:hypothetical protein
MTRHKVTALTIACCCLLGGFSSAAGAQTTADSFAELGGTLKRGKTVSITDDTGRSVTGKLTDLSATSLKVLVDGKEETLPEARVREVTERRHMTGSFARVGLLAGALAGVFIGLNAEDCFGCPGPGGTALAGGLALGGIGAAVGAAIGAQKFHDRLVYRASPRPPVALSLTPLVSAHATGVRAVVRF